MRYSIKRSVEVSRNLIFFQQAEQIGFFLSRAAISVANEVKSTSASHQYAVDISRCSFKKTNKKKTNNKNVCLPSPHVPLADM